MRFTAAMALIFIVLLAPAICDGSDADSYYAHYTSANGIELTFDNEGRTDANGTLSFTTYSKDYDLYRSTVIFYEYNASGNYGDTSKTYTFEVNDTYQHGYYVDFTVKNVNANIEIIFVEPVTYKITGYDPTGNVSPEKPDSDPVIPTQPSKIDSHIEIDVPTVVSALAIIISMMILIICIMGFNSITSVFKEER